MPSAGVWMLLVLATLIATTGLPVWALLIGVASAFAALGVVTGTVDVAILGAAVPRLSNLLEHDLLQAMPLYVFIGLLLQRLPVADALFRAFARLLHGSGAGNSLAAVAVGALVAPMNGSVASSASMLSRLVAPRLHGLPPAPRLALVSAAATIGVVVPPSLVLLLLGDAMLRAHTEAGNFAHAVIGGARIVNTQDVLHAALLPAVVLLAFWTGIAWWQSRRASAQGEPPRLSPRDAVLAIAAAGGVLALLGGVFVGRVFAVEAAATGGCLLVLLAVLTRALDGAAWRGVVEDTLALSGALFAVLVGATTFSLVFSVFGTGAWLAQAVLASPAPPLLQTLALLGAVAACAWVLDAFEMIFVVIPLVAPLLVLRLGDAQQASVLLLMVLQASFLLPPLGYAVLIARVQSGLPRVPTATLLRAAAPYLVAQLLVAGAVLAFPSFVHRLDASASASSGDGPLTGQELLDRIREMSPPDLSPPDADAAPR